MKRHISLLLVLCMVLSYIPAAAYAQETEELQITETVAEATGTITDVTEPALEETVPAVPETETVIGNMIPADGATESVMEETLPIALEKAPE